MPHHNRAILADIGIQKLNPKKAYKETTKKGLLVDDSKNASKVNLVVEESTEENVESSAELSSDVELALEVENLDLREEKKEDQLSEVENNKVLEQKKFVKKKSKKDHS